MSTARNTNSASVPAADLHALLVPAVRYSIGRMTYVVGRTCDLVRTYWPHLEAGTRDVLIRDVREAISDAERGVGSLGMDCDEREWRGLLAWMEATP